MRQPPAGGRSEVSSARCAERASEVGARGRTNKVSGRLITAILFGSAARRCSWENRIFCYQMTVRLRRFVPKPLLFRGQSQMLFLRRSEKLNDVKRVISLIRFGLDSNHREGGKAMSGSAKSRQKIMERSKENLGKRQPTNAALLVKSRILNQFLE
jgi:hypothetical protein